MACEPKLKVCVCDFGFAYDERTQLCQHKLTGPCPIGYKWNARVRTQTVLTTVANRPLQVHDCEGRGRHRGSDKMVDVVIVFVFFVILLLVIRKWKPSSYNSGLDRELSWPLRSGYTSRENPATVLFLSAARPSLWSAFARGDHSNGADNVSDRGPVPRYESSVDIFEPGAQEPPPSYEEAIAMSQREGKAAVPSEERSEECPSSGQSGQVSSENASNEAEARRQQLLRRRESDDPFVI